MEEPVNNPLAKVKSKEELKSLLGKMYDENKHTELVQLSQKIEAQPSIQREMLALAQFYHARALRKLGRSKDAIVLLEQAAQCTYTAIGAIHALGVIYDEQEDYQKALQYYELAEAKGHNLARESIRIVNGKTEARRLIERASTSYVVSQQEAQMLKKELENLRLENERLKSQLYAEKNTNFAPAKLPIQESDEGTSKLLDQVSEEKAKNEEERLRIEQERKDFELEKADFLLENAILADDLEVKSTRLQEEHVRLEDQRIEIENRHQDLEQKLKQFKENSAKQLEALQTRLKELNIEKQKLSGHPQLTPILQQIRAKEAELAEYQDSLETEHQQLLAEKANLEKDKEVIENKKSDLERQGLLLVAKESHLKQQEQTLKSKEDSLKNKEAELQTQLKNKTQQVSQLKDMAKSLHKEEKRLADLKEDFDKHYKRREVELKEEEARLSQKKELVDRLIGNAPRSKIREAIEKNKVSDFLELLDKSLREINQFDDRGRTLLHWAASVGNDRIVEILLIAGAEFRESPFDGRTPLDCCPGPSLFSTKNDKHAELKHKLCDPILKDKKPKMWSLLPALLKPPVSNEVKQFIQDNIKSIISCDELLDLKFNQLRSKGEALPPELNQVYVMYHQAFNLILAPEIQFKLDGWQLNDFSITRLVEDYQLCEKYSKEQKTPGKEHASQIASELIKRLGLILAFKKFGSFEVIKKILAAAKIEAAKYKLHYYFERYMFLSAVVNSFNNLSSLKKSEEINLKRLLEENKYRVGKFQELIAMPERIQVLKNAIDQELSQLVTQKEAYETIIKMNLPELLRIAELPSSEGEVFAKIFSNTRFGDHGNRQEQENAGPSPSTPKPPNASMPKQPFISPRDRQGTDASPMPALREFAREPLAPQLVYKGVPAATRLPVIVGEERETVYPPLGEPNISSPVKPAPTSVEISPQQITTTSPRQNPAVSASLQAHGLLKQPAVKQMVKQPQHDKKSHEPSTKP